MDFSSALDYGYYNRSPNYRCNYAFNPSQATYHGNALPSVAQYVNVGGQISPGRPPDHHEAGPSNNGTTVEIKVINPDKRSEIRLFKLRNVDCDKLSSPVDLNKVIFDQLGQNLVSKDLAFDVGYYMGNKRISILGTDDMEDVRKLLRNKDSSGVTLWCMGLSKRDLDLGKRSTRDLTDSGSDSDSEGHKRVKRRKKSAKKSRQEEKLERIDNIIDELKAKHGTEYTDIQYRVWAESFDTRYHQSLDNPPQGSLFKSQGKKSKSSKSDPPCSTSDPSHSTSADSPR